MREIVSPLVGIRSPFPYTASSNSDGTAEALAILGDEPNGFSLNFLSDGYAIRTFDAEYLIRNDGQALALEFTTDTFAMRQ